MVINGGSRSGSAAYTAYLGAHLQRTDTNERVLIRKIDGVAATDLTGAIREMAAIGAGARSQLPLYHANIDWRRDETMTDAQKVRAVERLGDELGLSSQPHVVIEHVKEGREHLHVVWCRIDPETMKAIPDSHNFRRHEIVARELEREFEHARVQGAHVERDGADRPARCPTLGETRQAERSSLTPEEARAQLRALWNAADNGQAFTAALADAGWMLARGDQRGFVALDPAGETHAVNKAITGLSAAKVRERLADIDANELPSVSVAREQLAARRQQQREIVDTPHQVQEPEGTPAAINETRGRAGEGAQHGEVTQSPCGGEQSGAEGSVHVRTRPAQALLRPAQVKEETQRPPIDLVLPKRGLLMRAVVAAWDALRSLGERLEKAFSAVMGQETKPEPHVEATNRLTLPAPSPDGRVTSDPMRNAAPLRERGGSDARRSPSPERPEPAPAMTGIPAPERKLETGQRPRPSEDAVEAERRRLREQVEKARQTLLQNRRTRGGGRGGPGL